MKVKVNPQQESETSPKDDADAHGTSSGISGGDDINADDRNAASRDGERQDRDKDGVHDDYSDADADGEVDTQASDPSTNSDSDTDSDSNPFEDAKVGRKRPPRGPPAGAGAERRGRGREHASGEGDPGIIGSGRGAGQNKRLHIDADNERGPEQKSS